MARLFLVLALALIFIIGTYAAIKVSNHKQHEPLNPPRTTPPTRNDITQSAEQALGITVLDKGEIGAIGTQHIFTDSVAVALMQGIVFAGTKPSNRYDTEEPYNIYELTLNFDNLGDKDIKIRKDSRKQFRLETLDDSIVDLHYDQSPYESTEYLNTVIIPAKGRKDVTLRFITQAQNPKFDMLVFNRKGPFTPNTVYWRL